jgi:site-specific DNA-methyltransferase (adenine-specific)
MNPYYEDALVTIYLGDCRDVLPLLPKTPLVVTDPPYAIGAGRGEWSATASVAIGLCEAAKRVDDGGALLTFTTSSGRGIEYTQGAVGKVLPFNRLLAWHKPRATSKAAGPFRWDLVCILGFGRTTFGTALQSSLVSADEPRAGREHPSQVPVEVAEWLYVPFHFELESGPVVDPFMGSGRLLMPAVRRGRRVIGVEIEERYCELAAQSLERESHLARKASGESESTPRLDGGELA